VAANATIMGDCTEYFPKQEEQQYAGTNISIVVFGHTHYPFVKKFESGVTTINEGTWLDNNTSYPGGLTRTFAVITTGKKTTAAVYTYETDSKITNVTKSISLKTSN
jgi:predicted phosphodiesterase